MQPAPATATVVHGNPFNARMPETPWPFPFWIAHRGAGTLAPENTLAAFRVGAAHGYRAFECDVKLSADGEPFLLHDTTLQRTTTGVGAAHELKWRQLSHLDAGAWHSRAFAGEPLPRLEAVAAYCLRNGFALNVELKPAPGHERATGRVVAATIARLWHGSRALLPLLSSFEPQALDGARATAPHLPRALLLDDMRTGWLDEAQALNCVAVVCDQTLLSADVIGSIRKAGLRTMAYTVNEADDARRLLAFGIDGLITDAVNRFAPTGDVLC